MGKLFGQEGMKVERHAVIRAIERGLAKGSLDAVAEWILEQWTTQPHILYQIKWDSSHGTVVHTYVAPKVKFIVRYPPTASERIATVILPDDYPTYEKAMELEHQGKLPLNPDGMHARVHPVEVK